MSRFESITMTSGRRMFWPDVDHGCYGLNCVFSKFMCSSPNPSVPHNVTVFGDRGLYRGN